MSVANTFSVWFLVFITYSVVGWCIEVLRCALQRKKFINRGFLIGPLCPIYGFGVLIMTLILGRAENIFEIFLVAIISSAFLEYITSYLMEKLFRVRWWDYSDMSFNIRGRICLRNLIYFGIVGVLVVKFANPVIFNFYEQLPELARLVIASILLLIFLSDLITSLWLIIGCRVTIGAHQADATEEITANIYNILMSKGKLSRRLAKAFPDMTSKKKTSCRSKS